MQSKAVFIAIVKVIGILGKNADFTRIQKVCHVIYTSFGSSVGKV